MIGTVSTAGEWIAVGAVLLIIGYLIKVRRWTFLIAGYDRSVDLPRSVAADIVGNLVLRVGIATIGIGAVAATGDASALGPIFAVLVALDLLRVVYRLNTYESSDATLQ